MIVQIQNVLDQMMGLPHDLESLRSVRNMQQVKLSEQTYWIPDILL